MRTQDIEAEVKQVVKKKQQFERLVITKEEGLEMFKYNPFKYQLISTKVSAPKRCPPGISGVSRPTARTRPAFSQVPDGTATTVYRCGDLIDLCRGPHVQHTGKVAAFKVRALSPAPRNSVVT